MEILSPPVLPDSVLSLSPDEADRLLDRLEREVPVHPPLVELAADAFEEAIVFGDTHGDWRSTLEVVARFQEPGRSRALIGLGDYVDRPPEDCGEGSVANAFFLLDLAARFPGRVFLLQGNHETVRRVPTLPHNLPEEVDQLWGPEAGRYSRLMGLLERGPFAVTTTNGAYLAHAGFPPLPSASRWQAAFDRVDDDVLIDLVWSGCDASRIHRGAVPMFGGNELDRFFHVTGLSVFLRGHDPDLTGRPVYQGRCLTLQTTRVYERFGGVIVARFLAATPLRSTKDLAVEHLPTEGRTFATT
ncbi:MAG TPA: metallophosphoesterase [Thermoplasmata archaeon]|nr:metallophosphoesterase [Thermoplasmata archaeon]